MNFTSSSLHEAGRSTYVRTTRKVFRRRKLQGKPRPRDKKDKLIDEFLERFVRDFDFSFVFSGDKALAKLAADDFYGEILLLSALEKRRQDSEDTPEDERYSFGDVMSRWNEIFFSWERSSNGFVHKLRSLVRSTGKKRR